MTPEQFCYWLQGYAELTGAEEVTPEVWASVKDHLKLVFEKKTPERIRTVTLDDALRKYRDGGFVPQVGQDTVTC